MVLDFGLTPNSLLSYFRAAVDATAANGFPLHTPAAEFAQPAGLRQFLRRRRVRRIRAISVSRHLRAFQEARAWDSPPTRFTSAKSRTLPRAPSSPRSIRPPPTCRTRSAKTKATTTRAPRIPNRRALERCVAQTRRRPSGLRLYLRDGGHRRHVSAAAARRPRHRLGRRLRRRLSPDHAVARAVRPRVQFRGYVQRRKRPSRAAAEHQDALRRDAHQSHDDRHRHRRDGRHRQRAQPHAGRGQHLPQSLPAAAARSSARTSSCTR